MVFSISVSCFPLDGCFKQHKYLYIYLSSVRFSQRNAKLHFLYSVMHIIFQIFSTLSCLQFIFSTFFSNGASSTANCTQRHSRYTYVWYVRNISIIQAYEYRYTDIGQILCHRLSIFIQIKFDFNPSSNFKSSYNRVV